MPLSNSFGRENVQYTFVSQLQCKASCHTSVVDFSLTLYAPNPQNDQTHSSNSSATADERVRLSVLWG